ncbi:MAG: TraX family protein [Clostridia bacterium]
MVVQAPKASVISKETLGGNTDTSLLKILALVFMLIDHVGAIFGARFFGGAMELRMLGRIAFPLYAWCLVVGSVKTHNPLQYALRLLLLAVISQPLYMMALGHTWESFNILFTLALGLLVIEGIRAKFYYSQIWAPALCYLLLGFVSVDYGWRGITFILVLYGARQTRGGLIAAFLAYAMFWGTSSSAIGSIFGVNLSFLSWPGLGKVLEPFFHLQSMVWLALPLVAFSTHSGLPKMPKWLGYGLYPLHLVLLIALNLLFGGMTLAGLIANF